MIGIYGVNPIGKIIIDILRSKKTDEKIVFIDDNPALQKTNHWGIPVEYNFQSWKTKIESSSEKFEMLIALGEKNLLVRKKIYDAFASHLNLSFPLLKDESSLVALDVKTGAGNIICKGSIIGHEVVLKNNSVFWSGSVVEHNSQIGESCYISPNATISGFVKIGDCTLIGSGAVILPELSIGKNCVIGAGSVVTKNIPDGSVVMGNPAKIVRSTIIHS